MSYAEWITFMLQLFLRRLEQLHLKLSLMLPPTYNISNSHLNQNYIHWLTNYQILKFNAEFQLHNLIIRFLHFISLLFSGKKNKSLILWCTLYEYCYNQVANSVNHLYGCLFLRVKQTGPWYHSKSPVLCVGTYVRFSTLGLK